MTTGHPPHEVTIPDEPLGAALDRAALRWPERVAVDFLGAVRRPTRELAGRGGARRAGAARPRRPARGPRRAGDPELHRPTSSRSTRSCGSAPSSSSTTRRTRPASSRTSSPTPARSSRSSGRRPSRRVLASLPQTRLRGRRRRRPDRRTCPRRAGWQLRLPVPRARRVRAAMRGPVPPAFPMWHRLVAKADPIDPAHPGAGRRPTSRCCSTPAGPRGRPKGAMLTHRNLVANAVQGQAWTGGRARHRGRLRRPAVLPRLRPDACA